MAPQQAETVIVAGFGTDVGRAREANEDAYYVTRSDLPPTLRTQKGWLYIVADGMGGYKGGARASQLAVTLISQAYYKDPDPQVDASLNRAIQKANQVIYREAQSNSELARMGTTTVAAVVRGRELVVANVGDSRAYLIRDGQIQLLTRDHSLVYESVNAGLMTDTEARRHPLRSAITRALGAGPEVIVDFFHLALKPGDRILLCTDGLSNEIRSSELARLASTGRPQDTVTKLIQVANERGGRDNITVLLVQVEAAVEKRGLMARLLGK